MNSSRLLFLIGFVTWLAVSLHITGAQNAAQEKPGEHTREKIYVYVTNSQSWEIRGGWGVSGNRNADGSGSLSGGGYTAGGARPQTAEIIKTFNQRCPGVTVTNNIQRANFAVTLDHEGGKGYLRHRNKIVVFNRDGDAIFSDSTRELGNSVKDACQAILSAPWKPQLAALPTYQTQTPQPGSAATVANQSQLSVDISIDIRSTPPGADVELDGNFVGDTPSAIGVAPGDHTIRVERNGYKAWERKIKVSSGRVNISAELEPEVKETAAEADATTTPESEKSKQKIELAASEHLVAPLAPAHSTGSAGTPENSGTVSLASDPSGAEVYVDDSMVGKAPVTLNLKPGQHYVRMFAKDYRNWSQQIMVVRGSELKLTAKLEKSD